MNKEEADKKIAESRKNREKKIARKRGEEPRGIVDKVMRDLFSPRAGRRR